MLLRTGSDVTLSHDIFQGTKYLSSQPRLGATHGERKTSTLNRQHEQRRRRNRAPAPPLKARRHARDTATGMGGHEAAMRLTTYTGPKGKAQP